MPCFCHACAILLIIAISPGYKRDMTPCTCDDIPVITLSYPCHKVYGTSMAEAWHGHGRSIVTVLINEEIEGLGKLF